MRPNPRWEIKYPLKQPYIDPDFAANELLLACVKVRKTPSWPRSWADCSLF
jgi:hypothetical protein